MNINKVKKDLEFAVEAFMQEYGNGVSDHEPRYVELDGTLEDLHRDSFDGYHAEE